MRPVQSVGPAVAANPFPSRRSRQRACPSKARFRSVLTDGATMPSFPAPIGGSIGSNASTTPLGGGRRDDFLERRDGPGRLPPRYDCVQGPNTERTEPERIGLGSTAAGSPAASMPPYPPGSGKRARRIRRRSAGRTLSSASRSSVVVGSLSRERRRSSDFSTASPLWTSSPLHHSAVSSRCPSRAPSEGSPARRAARYPVPHATRPNPANETADLTRDACPDAAARVDDPAGSCERSVSELVRAYLFVPRIPVQHCRCRQGLRLVHAGVDRALPGRANSSPTPRAPRPSSRGGDYRCVASRKRAPRWWGMGRGWGDAEVVRGECQGPPPRIRGNRWEGAYGPSRPAGRDLDAREGHQGVGGVVRLDTPGVLRARSELGVGRRGPRAGSGRPRHPGLGGKVRLPPSGEGAKGPLDPQPPAPPGDRGRAGDPSGGTAGPVATALRGMQVSAGAHPSTR